MTPDLHSSARLVGFDEQGRMGRKMHPFRLGYL